MGGKYCSNCTTEKLPRHRVACIASICNLLQPCVIESGPLIWACHSVPLRFDNRRPFPPFARIRFGAQRQLSETSFAQLVKSLDIVPVSI